MVRHYPPPGSCISYSAGSSNPDPFAYRILQVGGDRLGSARLLFPELDELLGDFCPVVINAYPAALGQFPGAIYVETHIRPQNVSRALLLAREMKVPAVLLGQPLPILHLLLFHLEHRQRLPERLVLCIGGYACPASLECALRGVIQEIGPNCTFLVIHAYGAAEIDAACLLGMARTSEGLIKYVPASPCVIPEVEEGLLQLRLRVHDQDRVHQTDDRGELVKGHVVIRNSTARLDPQLYAHLESWDAEQWCRRTGYCFWGSEPLFQLRKGIVPNASSEISFGLFTDRFAFSWLDKPLWGLQPGESPQTRNLP